MLAFALYTFFFLEAELLFTECISAKFSESTGTVFYGLFCLAAAAGFFSFAFIRRRLFPKAERLLLFLLSGAGVVCILAAAAAGAWLTAVFTLLTMALAGLVGASLLSAVVFCINEKFTLGLFIALPYAAAFLLQCLLGYILPWLGKNEPVLWHIAIAAAFCAVPFFSHKYIDFSTQNQKAQIADGLDTRRYLAGILIAGLIIFCLYGMIDGIIMTLHASQELNVYGYVRLIAVPGIVFAGWVADFRDGRYFSFAAAIAMTAVIAAVFLFNSAITFNAALGSVYFFSSFMTMYSLAVFIRVAESTGFPALWAVAGRGLKYLVGGIFALAGSLIFSYFSLLLLALIYLTLLIALFTVFYFQGKLTPAVINNATAPPPDIPLADLLKSYGFTNREAEVLELLIAGQDTAGIAQKMAIAEKTVQNYVNALLSKTGTNSRLKLIALINRQTR